MSYKIYFKGDRPAEVIHGPQAEEMYNDYQSGNLPDIIEIKPGLTLPRSAINGMEKVKDHAPVRRETTPSELKQFAEKVRPYLEPDGVLSLDGQLRFLEAEGLIRLVRNPGVTKIKTTSDCVEYVKDHLVDVYEGTLELISQYNLWHGRKAYADRKKLEHYQQMAKAA